MGLDDDFYDIAAIGLCKAALRFKNPNKVRFSTFAYHIIQNEIINEFDYRNAKKRTGTTVSMNAPLIADSELTLGAMLYHPDTPETIAFAKDLMTALRATAAKKTMRLSIKAIPIRNGNYSGSPKRRVISTTKRLRAEDMRKINPMPTYPMQDVGERNERHRKKRLPMRWRYSSLC